MATEKNATDCDSTSSVSSFLFQGLLAGVWTFLSGLDLEPSKRRISHKTANHTITTEASGTTFTNFGASGTITITLPPAVVDTHFKYIVRVAQTLRVLPATGERVETAANPRVLSAVDKYISSATIGSSLHLVCIEAGRWAIERYEGTWAVQA